MQFSYSNLMLMCDTHHRLIDKKDVAGHPVERLREMKGAHESRIERQTDIQADRQSHVLLYGANVGGHASPVSYPMSFEAMLPDRYPAEATPIVLGMKNSSYTDKAKDFWKIESNHLRSMFIRFVEPRLKSGEIRHLSIFAVAPQPLLMLLGTLLSDIHPAEVYQYHKEPERDWKWQPNPEGFEYRTVEPPNVKGPPALIIALSGDVPDERATDVLGTDVTIWRITVTNPNNDLLKSREQARLFRERVRILMDRIKARHGEKSTIHVFPAMPVALAIEFGRIIMPKADLPLRIYDKNNAVGGTIHALDINAYLPEKGSYAGESAAT